MAKANGAKVMTALLAALPSKQQEFSQVLRGLEAQISAQPGCLDCVVGQAMGGENRYVLCSVWRDSKALEDHLSSESFLILRGATNILSAPGDFRLITADVQPASP
jgi:quinol monooxygenase YgiN